MLATFRVQQQAWFSMQVAPFVLSRDVPTNKVVQLQYSFISKMIRYGNNI